MCRKFPLNPRNWADLWGVPQSPEQGRYKELIYEKRKSNCVPGHRSGEKENYGACKEMRLKRKRVYKAAGIGYAPQPVLPEVIFPLLEKIGQLQDLTASPETDAAICTLLKEISDTLLLPRKEGVPWPLPDSGL